MKRERLLTIILCALIGLVFLRQIQVALSLGESINQAIFSPDNEVLKQSGAAYSGMSLSSDWWRLVTSIFNHGGIVHLAANAIALWQLGALLEELFGATPLAISFAIGGLVAGLSTIAMPGTEPGIVYVGASGAIFAIAGTLLVGLRRVSHLEGGQWSRQLSSRLLGCLGFNLVLGLGVSAFAAWADLGFAIAVTAHVAGLIAGAVVGIAMRMKLRDSGLTRRLMGIA